MTETEVRPSAAALADAPKPKVAAPGWRELHESPQRLPPIEPSAAYLADLGAWRAARPQYKRVLEGVKRDAPTGELRCLASDAGVTDAELNDLRNVRSHALHLANLPARVAEAEKQLRAAEQRVKDNRDGINSSDPIQRRRARLDLPGSEVSAQSYQGNLLGLQSEQRVLEYAKQLGVV